MDSLIFELQIVFYFQFFLSANVRHKIRPRAYIFQRPFLRALSVEGNLRFKMDLASPIVKRKFTFLALFYFVFEGNLCK